MSTTGEYKWADYKWAFWAIVIGIALVISCSIAAGTPSQGIYYPPEYYEDALNYPPETFGYETPNPLDEYP